MPQGPWDEANMEGFNIQEKAMRKHLDRKKAVERGQIAYVKYVTDNRQVKPMSCTERRLVYDGRLPVRLRIPLTPSPSLSSLYDLDDQDENVEEEETPPPISPIVWFKPRLGLLAEKNSAEKEVDAFILADVEGKNQLTGKEKKKLTEKRQRDTETRYQKAINKLHLEQKLSETLEELEWAQKAYAKHMALKASIPNSKFEQIPQVKKLMVQEENLKMEQLAESALKLLNKKKKEHAIEDLEGYYDDVEENFNAKLSKEDVDARSVESIPSFSSLLATDPFFDSYFKRTKVDDVSKVSGDTITADNSTSLERGSTPIPSIASTIPRKISRTIAVQVQPRLQSKQTQFEDSITLDTDEGRSFAESLRVYPVSPSKKPLRELQDFSLNRKSPRKKDHRPESFGMESFKRIPYRSFLDYPLFPDPFKVSREAEDYFQDSREADSFPDVAREMYITSVKPTPTAIPLGSPIRQRPRTPKRSVTFVSSSRHKSKTPPKTKTKTKTPPKPKTKALQEAEPDRNLVRESILRVISGNKTLSPPVPISQPDVKLDDVVPITHKRSTRPKEAPDSSMFVNQSQNQTLQSSKELSELQDSLKETTLPKSFEEPKERIIPDGKTMPFVYHDLSTIQEMDSTLSDRTLVEGKPSPRTRVSDVTCSDLISNIRFIASSSSEQLSQGSSRSSPRGADVSPIRKKSKDSQILSLLKKMKTHSVEDRVSTAQSSRKVNALIDTANDMMKEISSIRLVASLSDSSTSSGTVEKDTKGHPPSVDSQISTDESFQPLSLHSGSLTGFKKSSSQPTLTPGAMFQPLSVHSGTSYESLGFAPRISLQLQLNRDLRKSKALIPTPGISGTSSIGSQVFSPLSMKSGTLSTVDLSSKKESDATIEDFATKDKVAAKTTWKSSSSEESLSQMFAPSKHFFQSTPMKLSMQHLEEERGILDEPDLTLVGSELSLDTSSNENPREEVKELDFDKLSRSMISFLQHEISNIADDEEEI